MLFGNGLSALLTLMGISGGARRAVRRRRRWRCAGGGRAARLARRGSLYFGALGAGFMLIEVAMLQRFVLLLGHPVYSLTVTLFSLLLGTGLGAALSRRFDDRDAAAASARSRVADRRAARRCVVHRRRRRRSSTWAIPFSRGRRGSLIAVAMLVPLGMLLGIPMPAGLRLLSARAPQMVTWAWGMNGALSVVGATLAIFIAMNWGFRVTLLAASGTYLVGLVALLVATRPSAPDRQTSDSGSFRPPERPSRSIRTQTQSPQPSLQQLNLNTNVFCV